MEDTDDFEFVDNDKVAFDQIVDVNADNAADTLLSRAEVIVDDDDDDFGALTSLNKQMKDVQEMKKHLRRQYQESQQLMKSLQEQSKSTQELQNRLQDELKEVEMVKESLAQEREQFEAQKQQLSSLLSSMVEVPNQVKKSSQLVAELQKFYKETSSVEQELSKLKQMRIQQQDMINACKVSIETINSNQKDCLVSLDKSKSYACKECGTDIALKDDIESKCYQVGQGSFTEKKRGYLFQSACNTVMGATKTENFTTGSYKISWVSCAKCNHQMGWKYISADNPNNSAKVGKFCLARYSLTSPEDRAKK